MGFCGCGSVTRRAGFGAIDPGCQLRRTRLPASHRDRRKAFRHSGARLIEGVLEYSRNRFRMLVRDNGCGMDADVVRSGREGHWGLTGMSERSERIAARLTVLSAPGAGTEIDLVISGHVAFESGAARD